MLTWGKRVKRMTAQVLVTGMAVLGMAGVCYGASDLTGHWAAPQINAWITKGIIKGYPDGTVRPDTQVTRAEFMAMVNKAYNLNGSSGVSYTDVNSNKWYAPVVSAASAAGYIGGYPDGTMRPNSPISRFEAAVIIMKVSKLTADASNNSYFSDNQRFPAWAQGAVGAAFKKGIMSGYPDGSFSGTKYISRAEAVISLTRSAATPVVEESVNKIYAESGSYGADTTQTIKGNVTIKAAGVTLRNMVVEGNLTIDRTVGNGDVTLRNVTIRGNTYINGGGPNSVYFTNVVSKKTYIAKDSGTVRLVVAGSSALAQVIAQSDMKLEETSLSGSGVDTLSVETNAVSGIDVELIGTKLTSLEMNAVGATLNADPTSGITRLTVSARDALIALQKGSTISTLVANAAVKVTGTGVISRADINANNVTLEIKPGETNVKSGITAPVTTGPTIQSFSPADGATKVAVNSDIVITFSEAVRMTDGDTTLTNSNVYKRIVLKSSSASGTSVGFDASVRTSSGKTIITIDPTSNLSTGRTYYVAVDGLEDTDNNALSGTRSATFTTISDSAPKVETFSPASGSTNVSLTSKVVITFSETVRRISGNATLVNSNVGALVTLRKTNSSGSTIPFSASVTVSGGKTVITVTPDSNLLNGQLYYVSVSGLEDSDDLELTGTTSSTFTTDYLPFVESFNPASNATGASLTDNIVLTMNETLRLLNNTTLSDTNVDAQITLKKDSGSGAGVPFDAKVTTASGKTVITVDPTDSLNPNQVYYVAVTGLEDSVDQGLTGTLAVTFRTMTDTAPIVESFAPASGATNVSATGNLVITFNETLRLIDNSPLDGTNAVALTTLKKTNASGTAVPFHVAVATVSGKTVMTVDPDANLDPNQLYYLAVTGLEDLSNQVLTGTLNATFTTAPLADPVPTIESFNPANGAVDVSLTGNILISFSEIMRNLDNTELLNNNVDSLITLKTPGSSGANVDFNATVDTSSGKTVIIVNPDADLQPNTIYYVAVTGIEDTANQAVSGNSTFATIRLQADPLTALTVDLGTNGSGGALVLSPAFAGGTATYTGDVASTVEGVRLTVTAPDGNTAAISMGGSVKADGVCSLATGSNTITVTVSKSGCTDRTYTLTLTKAAGDTTAPSLSGTVADSASQITFTYSEALSLVSGADLRSGITYSLSGGAPVSLAGGDSAEISGSTVVLRFGVPLAPGTYTLNVNAGILQDGAGNSSGAATGSITIP